MIAEAPTITGGGQAAADPGDRRAALRRPGRRCAPARPVRAARRTRGLARIRSYSIANAPRRDGLVSLLVTRVLWGQVFVLGDDVLRPGDRVLSGPYGSFTAAPGEPGPVLYLAGGSGLAPVRALAEAALWGRTRAPVVLFFSARTQQDLIDDERYRTWQRRHPGFRYLRR